jgi:Vanadium chloroperoxidase N-terminal domain
VKQKLATTLLMIAALVAAMVSAETITARPALAAGGPAWPIDNYGLPRTNDNVILKWDEQLLSVIRAYPGKKGTGPTIAARALGVLHTATYEAWAAYDPKAVSTVSAYGPPPQQDNTTIAGANNDDNKNKAISFAAYRVLMELFPPSDFPNSSDPVYNTPDALMTTTPKAQGGLEYSPAETDGTPAVDSPAEVGNVAAEAVMKFRRDDGSNQRNGYAPSPYTSQNFWNSVPVKGHWQPLCVLTALGVMDGFPPVRDPSASACPDSTTASHYALQSALTPQWGNITPFGDLTPYPPQFSLPGPPKLADGSYDPWTDVDTAVKDTSNLTDAQKVKAEYWADGPKSEFPPGHMAVFAQALSRMRGNTLDQDTKLFFILGNAMLDASKSAWAAKYQYDFWRPTSAIRTLYQNKLVTSWLGPGKGFGRVQGQNWMPYQALTVVTPAFPEYVSGHSTFSAAGRTVLLMFYGNDDSFNAKVTIKKGSSKIEPNVTPAKDVVLSWNTLSAAADEAGMSRRWGGIHFYSGDQQGRGLGRLIGYNDFNLAQTYFNP